MLRLRAAAAPSLARSLRPAAAAATASPLRAAVAAAASLPSPHRRALHSLRALSASSPSSASNAFSSPQPPASFDVASSLDSLATQFASSRLDIEDAVESAGTTYYPSDVQAAIDSTNDTLMLFEQIQTKLGAESKEAIKLRESWGLRLEQLKAELAQAIAVGGGEEH